MSQNVHRRHDEKKKLFQLVGNSQNFKSHLQSSYALNNLSPAGQVELSLNQNYAILCHLHYLLSTRKTMPNKQYLVEIAAYYLKWIKNVSKRVQLFSPSIFIWIDTPLGPLQLLFSISSFQQEVALISFTFQQQYFILHFKEKYLFFNEWNLSFFTQK